MQKREVVMDHHIFGTASREVCQSHGGTHMSCRLWAKFVLGSQKLFCRLKTVRSAAAKFVRAGVLYDDRPSIDAQHGAHWLDPGRRRDSRCIATWRPSSGATPTVRSLAPACEGRRPALISP